MAFKLGKESRLSSSNNSKNHFDTSDASVPGVKVIRKSLARGVQGEANNDDTIFLSDKIEPGSAEERKVLMHEMAHMVDMKTGKLAYTDDSLTWMGEDYARSKGKIEYNGQWLPEGNTEFPWEKH